MGYKTAVIFMVFMLALGITIGTIIGLEHKSTENYKKNVFCGYGYGYTDQTDKTQPLNQTELLSICR